MKHDVFATVRRVRNSEWMASVRIAVVRRRWLELGALLALVMGAVVVAGVWGAARRAAPDAGLNVREPRTATPAPPFELADLAGRPVRLADYRGRVVLLNFWATWCAPCRDEIPALETLARELAPQGLVVLAVNYQESAAVVEGFVREYGVAFPVLLDQSGEVATGYGVFGLPATFLIGRDGALAASALGFRDWGSRAARAYVGRLLAARA